MTLLNDKQILEGVTGDEPIIRGLKNPADWYSSDSPVQAASVDLHIGPIYKPGTREDDPGGEKNPEKELVLGTGHTAIVATREELSLPPEVAGVGFPPSRVSVRGLLMTNPGHVDPGYRGPMRFTVINMGRENFVLREGDPIVTLLLIKLSQSPQSDWLTRRQGSPGVNPKQREINRLSEDFINVEKRATDIANAEVKKAQDSFKELESKWLRWGGLITAGATLLGAILSGTLIYFTGFKGLEHRTDLLENDLKQRVNIERKLDELDSRLKAVEKPQAPLPAEIPKDHAK